MQVTAFSRWEKELPKLIGDARYKALPSMKDRKSAFEEFCRDSSSQRRKAKAIAGSQGEASASEEAKAGFKSLMTDASTRTVADGRLSFE